MINIIVASWGNPFAWKPSSYRLEIGEGKVIRKTGVNTSLVCLAEVFSPDRILILIPETLLCPGLKYEEKLRKCKGLTFTDSIENLTNFYDTVKRYGDLVSSLKGAVEKFSEEILPVKRDVVRFVLAPNVGIYSCSRNGSGLASVYWKIGLKRVDPVSSYAAYVLVSTIASVIELMENNSGDELRLILDTTHGINYMPVAAYRATIVAARIISAMFNVSVNFLQFNSDPVIGGASASKDFYLEIHKVREERVSPNKAAQRLVYSYLIREAGHAKIFYRNKEEIPQDFQRRLSEKEKVFRELSLLHRSNYSQALSSSIHYSMPLAFLQAAYKIRREFNGDVRVYLLNLHKFLQELLSIVKIQFTGNMYNVLHLVLPSYDDIKSLLSIVALAEYGINTCNSIINRISTENDIIEVPIELLKEVSEKWLEGPLSLVTKHELNHFEGAFKGKEIPYKELKNFINNAKQNMGKWFSYKGVCENQPRIMVAHSGLAFKSIEVKATSNTLYIRYKKECLQDVVNSLKLALKSTRELIRH